MTEHALMLLNHATRLPDVSQAFVVTHDRIVMGASNRGESLPDSEACLAIYDTLEGLCLYQLDAGYYRWNFPGRTLILFRSSDCTFGTFVRADHTNEVSRDLAAHYRQFIADLEADREADAMSSKTHQESGAE